MTYELATANSDGTFDSAGNFETADQAYAAAKDLGEGNYAGTRDANGGHYEEEIQVTAENAVLVRAAGQDWSEWDG